MTTERHEVSWPTLPYKGLTYYGPVDVPLFAGREGDVEQCAKLLGLNSTRILILHGATGCGKSSFLRAGLIPFVEQGGFAFQRDTEAGKAIFVRSTDNPLGKLAESVYDFCSQTYQIDTYFGSETLDLSKLLSAYKDRTDFLERAGARAEEIVQVLNEIASSWPLTLVLVIDQAEEVLTVNVGEEGEKYRKQLFEFMSLFSKKKFDLKLLVALRTEFYGRFFDRVRQVAADTVNIRDYLLSELSEDQIIAAIERPTRKVDIGSWGKPYDQYRFEYQPGVAETIANDLKAMAGAGGGLPVMQIVCDNLYRLTKLKAEALEQTHWVIKENDYRDLGGIEGQMDGHVRRVLEDLCRENSIRDLAVVKEMDAWKEVLSKLVKTQVDGTVTTELSSAESLKKIAEETGCKIPFDAGALYLSNDERRILRPVDVIDLKTKKPIHCYSLGHDVIGLVLRRWQLSRETPNLKEARAAEERLRFWTERGQRSFARSADGNQRSLGSLFLSLLSQPIPVTESVRLWRFADKDRRRILKRNILVFCSRVLAAALAGLLLFAAASFAITKWTHRESNQIREVMKNAPVRDVAANEASGKGAVSNWAKALISAGDIRGAIEALSFLKADVPGSPSLAEKTNYYTTDVYADVADTLYKSDRKNEADNLWKQAIEKMPGESPDSIAKSFRDSSLRRLIPPLIRLGKYQEALDVIHKINSKSSQLIGLVAVAVARNPQSEPADAERQWSEVMDYAKDSGYLADQYFAYIATAMAYAGRFDQALSVIRRIGAQKNYPQSWADRARDPALESVAQSLAKAGRFSEALVNARQIKSMATHVDAVAYVALYLTIAGKTDEANKEWEEAKQLISDFQKPASPTGSKDVDTSGQGQDSKSNSQLAFASIARRYAQAGNAEEATNYLGQALKDEKLTATDTSGPDPRLDALYAVIAALGKSGQDSQYAKAHKLAIRSDDVKIRGRALTVLNKALTRAGKAKEALDFARQEDGVVRVNALSAVAQALTEMNNVDDAKKVWDEASQTAGQVGNVIYRSSAFATIGKGLACLHLYYDARAAGDLCGIPSDRLEVYAAILAVHELARQGHKAGSETECFGSTQMPWEIKYDFEPADN